MNVIAPHPPAPPAALTRAVRASLVLLTLAGVIATATRAGLSWDGSFILFSSLNDQGPFVTHHRWTSNLLLGPIVLASKLTDNLTLLAMLFTALMAAIPVLCLWLCWRMLRSRRPELVVWPTLGIGVVTLPGQFFFAGEALAATHVMWIVACWVALGCPRRWTAGAVVAATAALFLHPAAAVLTVLVGFGLAGQAWWRKALPATRWWWAGAAGFVAAGVARGLTIRNSGYEADSAGWEALRFHLRTAVLGAPLAAWGGATLVAAVLLLRLRGRLADVALLGGTTLALGSLLWWALRPDWWAAGIDTRSWAPLMAGVLMLGCMVVGGRSRPAAEAEPVVGAEPDHPTVASDSHNPARSTPSNDPTPTPATAPNRQSPSFSPRALPAVVVGAALTYLLVIGLQSAWWNAELNRLSDRLNRPGPACELVHPLADPIRASDHWGIRPLSVLLQGRSPQRLLADRDLVNLPPHPPTCRGLEGDPLPIAPYMNTPRHGGWFDLSHLHN